MDLSVVVVVLSINVAFVEVIASSVHFVPVYFFEMFAVSRVLYILSSVNGCLEFPRYPGLSVSYLVTVVYDMY